MDDLPDEILLNIFKRLDEFDALYSLVGVNQKLNNVVCDAYFTRTVDLTTIPFDQMDDSTTNAILHRFSVDILPRIRHKMECLAIQGCFWQHALHSSHYLGLHKLTLIKLQLNMVFDIFSGMSFGLLCSRNKFICFICSRRVSMYLCLQTSTIISDRNDY